MRLSNYSRDTYIAPKLSKLNLNGMPDLTEWQKPWTTNFLLSHIFRGQVEEKDYKYIVNILRRVEGTMDAYNLGRKALQTYLDQDSVPAYYRTIKELEVAVGLAYQGYKLTYQMIGEKKYFIQGSGNTLEQLNKLYNSCKHYDERIFKDLVADSPVPLWITNVGIEGIDSQLTFIEFAALLKDLVASADLLQDPISIPRN